MPEIVYTPNNPEGRRQVTQEDLLRSNQRQSDKMAQIALAQLRQQAEMFNRGQQYDRYRFDRTMDYQGSRDETQDDRWNRMFDWQQDQGRWQRGMAQEQMGFDRTRWGDQVGLQREGLDLQRSQYETEAEIAKRRLEETIAANQREYGLADRRMGLEEGLHQPQMELANLQVEEARKRAAAVDRIGTEGVTAADRIRLGGDPGDLASPHAKRNQLQALIINNEEDLQSTDPAIRDGAMRRIRSEAASRGLDPSIVQDMVPDPRYASAGDVPMRFSEVAESMRPELETWLEDLDATDRVPTEAEVYNVMAQLAERATRAGVPPEQSIPLAYEHLFSQVQNYDLGDFWSPDNEDEVEDLLRSVYRSRVLGRGQ